MINLFGSKCSKHNVEFQTREMDGGKYGYYCPSCEHEQREILNKIFEPTIDRAKLEQKQQSDHFRKLRIKNLELQMENAELKMKLKNKGN